MTDKQWASTQTLAIPKEGYFEKEDGRYGPRVSANAGQLGFFQFAVLSCR